MNLTIRILAIIFLISSTNLFAQIAVDQSSGCDTLTVQFSDQSAATAWNWDFGDGNTDNTNPTENFYADTGTYIVTLRTNLDTVTRTIHVYASPVADFDTTTLYYASFTLLVHNQTTLFNPVSDFLWDFGDGSPLESIFETSHKYGQEGNYPVELKVVDVEGCRDSITKIVSINHQFILFNTFTPNGDNLNDRFEVLSNGLEVFPEANFYNRWGTLVYRVQNVKQIIWDGRTFDGSLVAPGTYFYVITAPENSAYTYPDNTIKGSVQVFYDRSTLE